MTSSEPADLATRFNSCINARDLPGLAALMADDHVFVDTAGTRVEGKPACVEAWRGFFAAFPDYRNVFTSAAINGDSVTITGYSICSVPELAGPAQWTATTRAGLITLWQVAEVP